MRAERREGEALRRPDPPGSLETWYAPSLPFCSRPHFTFAGTVFVLLPGRFGLYNSYPEKRGKKTKQPPVGQVAGDAGDARRRHSLRAPAPVAKPHAGAP